MFVDAITYLTAGDDVATSLGFSMVGTTSGEGGLFRKILVVESSDPEEMRKAVYKNRKKYELIAVKPLSFPVTREASRFKLVDVILDPYEGRNDIGVDHITLKFASENNIAIGLSFYNFLMTHKKERVRTLRFMRKIIQLSMKYRTPLVITSGARDKFELRGPREMMSLAINLGADFQTAQKSVSSTPESIFTTNRMKIEGKMFAEVMEYE